MICTILKEEIDCVFMTRQGCIYYGGHCDPVVQACEGCNHIKEIEEDFYCTTARPVPIRQPSGTWASATTPPMSRRRPPWSPRPR